MDNPYTSGDARQHAYEMLHREEDSAKNKNRVEGGLKAAIKNPRVTESGKKEAQEKLDIIESNPKPSGGSREEREDIESYEGEDQ
ncbi:hypothetical protein KEM55_006598 [Ascosphaera atra]|nr:hypothetical protein KEM55_006598 [Ascosphaera atra]